MSLSSSRETQESGDVQGKRKRKGSRNDVQDCPGQEEYEHVCVITNKLLGDTMETGERINETDMQIL